MGQSNTQKEEIYSAGIAYNPERIRRLSLVQYSTFRSGTKFGMMLLAFLLILLGLSITGRGAVSLVPLAVGSILLASVNFPAHTMAETTIRQYAGRYPDLRYHFSETGICTSQVPQEYPYAEVIRLLEDNSYFYIYINTLSAFMVERSSVRGEGGEEGFRSFLSEKTQLGWTKPPTLFNMNLKHMRSLFHTSDRT